MLNSNMPVFCCFFSHLLWRSIVTSSPLCTLDIWQKLNKSSQWYKKIENPVLAYLIHHRPSIEAPAIGRMWLLAANRWHQLSFVDLLLIKTGVTAGASALGWWWTKYVLSVVRLCRFFRNIIRHLPPQQPHPNTAILIGSHIIRTYSAVVVSCVYLPYRMGVIGTTTCRSQGVTSLNGQKRMAHIVRYTVLGRVTRVRL